MMTVLNNQTIVSMFKSYSIIDLLKMYKIVGEDKTDYNGQICDLDPSLLTPLIVSLNSLLKPRYASNLLNTDESLTILGRICIIAKNHYNDMEFKTKVEKILLSEGWRKIVEYNNSSFKIDEGGKLYVFNWES